MVGRDGRFDGGAATTLSSVGSVTDRTTGASSRFAEWEVGWRIVLAHPWLGVGPEGYRTALADGVTRSYEQTYGRTVMPDRAHNAILDVAAAGGLAAGLAYAGILVLVVSRRGGRFDLACPMWRSLRPSWRT